MKIILFLSLLFLNSTSPGCLKMDLILIGDYSASVQGYEGFVSDAFVTLIQRLDLDENGIEVGVIVFNCEPTVISNISSNKDSVLAKAAALKVFPATSMTNAASAFQAALGMFVKNRTDATKLIVFVSDGDVDNEANTRVIASQLKMTGVGICTVLIKDNSAKSSFMESISTGCYVETDYDGLAKILKDLDLCL